MAATSTDIVNQALQYMGDNAPAVTGVAPNFDSSIAGVAAAMLYVPCVQFVARQFGWDFARGFVVLTASGNVAPAPWSNEYLYPAMAVQIWQLMPAAPDANDPRPVRWSRGNALVGGTQTAVLWSNQAAARAYYNNNPAESVWDPGFREAVTRQLAAEFSTALAGRPETAALMLQSGQMAERIAELRGS